MKNFIIFKRFGNAIPVIVITIIAVIALSCKKDFLVEKPKSFLGPANTFLTPAGFQTAVVGLYVQQKSELVQENYHFVQIGTDLYQCGLAWAPGVYLEQLGTYVQPSSFGFAWNWGYVLVGNANQILSNLKNPGVNWATPADKNQVEAEARFFRAYAYRFMMYCYGNLPIVTELTKPFRNDFTRAPMADVSRLIINDLLFASANLPATTTQDGRLVQAAAQHYLSEMYLFINKPDSAKIMAQLVTGNTNFSLMTSRFGNNLSEPGDVFSDLFKEHNVNRGQGNKEGIWVQQWEYKAIGGSEGYNVWQRRDLVCYYSNVNGFVLCDSLGGRGIGRIRPLMWWVNSAYETQDIRNSKYNLKRHWYYNDPSKTATYGKEAVITDATRSAGNLFECTTKFNFGKTADDPTYLNTCKDIYKIRLAETYLLLAEAQMKLGDLTGAAASINVVRSRANATPVTPAQVTMDYILDERARELYGEEFRRFTLFRTGTFKDRVIKLNPVAGPVFKDFNVLLPIPQTAIDANTGAVLEQNPGF